MYMMDFAVDLNVQRPHRSVKNMNYWTTNPGDLFIVEKVYAEPAKLLE